MTGYLQPLDVMINKPFKDRVRQLFNEWWQEIGSKEDNLTKKGYIKPPSSDLMIHWIYDAWANIHPDLVAFSFEYCGLTTKPFDRSKLNPDLYENDSMRKTILEILSHKEFVATDDALEIRE